MRFLAHPSRALCGGRQCSIPFTQRLEATVAYPHVRWALEDDVGTSSTSAVAGPAPIDAMSELEDISSESATPQNNRTGYASKRGQNNITYVNMSEFEPTSHPHRKGYRKVKLLVPSTNSLLMCIDDIAWLVKWLSDELRSCGVPLELNDPVVARECNCERKTCTPVGHRWLVDGNHP